MTIVVIISSNTEYLYQPDAARQRLLRVDLSVVSVLLHESVHIRDKV